MIYVLLLSFEMQVSITPEVTSKKVSRDIIKQLVKLYKEHLGMRDPAYDGRKSLYTAGPLPFMSKEFVVKLDNDDRASSSGSKGYFSSLSVRIYPIFVEFMFSIFILTESLFFVQRAEPGGSASSKWQSSSLLRLIFIIFDSF